MNISILGKFNNYEFIGPDSMFPFKIGQTVSLHGSIDLIIDYDLEDGHISYWMFNTISIAKDFQLNVT